MKFIAFLLVLAAGTLQAQIDLPEKNATVYCCGGVIAQIVDGGSWKTTITLVNFERGLIATYTLRFYNNAGQPMFLPTNVGVVSSISGVLPINGSRTIETPGIQPGVQEGWAEIETYDHIGGTGIFRLQTNPLLPAVEVASPIETEGFEQTFRLPYDHIGAAAGLAIVNPSSYSTITVFVLFRDENGNQFILDSFMLGPRVHTTFMLQDRYPASAGRRGMVEFSSTSGFNILGLRATTTVGGVLTLTSIAPQSQI
jgi:hypothetical protein